MLQVQLLVELVDPLSCQNLSQVSYVVAEVHRKCLEERKVMYAPSTFNFCLGDPSQDSASLSRRRDDEVGRNGDGLKARRRGDVEA